MSDQDQVTGQDDPVQDVLDQELPVTDSEPMPSSEEEVTTEESEVEDSQPDRTGEQFDKLIEANRRLKEELEATKRAKDYGQSVLDTALPQYQEPQHETPYQQEYVDPISRELTEVKQAVRDLAEERRQKMVEDAHQKHPYLNPKDGNFDPQFYTLVRDRLVREMAQGVKRPLSAVADEIATFYKPAITPEKVEAEKKAAIQEDRKIRQQKAQVSQPAQNSARRVEGPDEEDLRHRTRFGDKEAFAERLRRAGL